MKIFISGGCKNGKSSIAEDCCKALAKDGPLYYIATMKAMDDEDLARIARHVKSRDGKGFITIEQPIDILKVLEKSDPKNGTYLLDSVTALLINEMYGGSADGNANKDAAKNLAEDLAELSSKVKNIVFVSDFIYEEADNYSEYTKEYIKALALCDRTLSSCCDTVAEIAFANINILKGELPL